MSSFELDEICRAHLRNAGAPVADYAEPNVSDALEALKATHRRMVQATAALCVCLGFAAGMAAVAIPLIFGAA